jgi:hypothetical protein
MNMVDLGLLIGGVLIAMVAIVRAYPLVQRLRAGASNELNVGQAESAAPARSSI